MEAEVSDFLASLTSQPAYSESTRLAYASDLRVFMGYLQTALRRPPALTDFNATQVAGFLAAEDQAGRRQNTLVRRRATLRRFLAYLRATGLLEWTANEFAVQPIDAALSSGAPTYNPQCLSETEIRRLWAAIETSPRPRARRDQAILLLLLETGLTVGALVALDITDIDLRAGRIHLATEKNRGHWLPLNHVADALNRYLREGRPELNPQPDESALFVSQMGGRMSRQGIWQILHHWGQQTEPPFNLSPRLVRHTAALRMTRSGRSIAEIQALLGHSNLLSTQALLRRLRSANGETNE